jgi:Protein of unknown function (DUF1553)/Protein of unknown function (DUF1549)
MRRIPLTLIALFALLGGARLASAAEADFEIPETPAPLSEIERDAIALAEKIDALIAAKYKDKNVQPAPLSDDSEFLRRAFLDLNGRIPGLGMARDFPQMSWKHKRLELLRQLLKDPRYATHFTNVWRSTFLPAPSNDVQQFQLQGLYSGFDTWMREELRKPSPRFDRMARTLINGAGLDGRTQGAATAFYQANEYKIENLASSTSRLFLGVKLECAQCHDHPFASWRRKQFWEYAAFFNGISQRAPNAKPTLKEFKIPGTDKVVKPRFPDGTEPKGEEGADARGVLLEWMTSEKNPFFAKAAVNRMWEHFLGTGLIEPIEEPSDDNPPSHPELLDLMAKEFAAHQFDLRFLTLAITASKTYQLSSAFTNKAQEDPRLFSRAVVRGLSAEQVLESMARAASHGSDKLNSLVNDPQAQQFGMQTTLRGEFLGRFPLQPKKSEAATSILQALFMMNSKVTEQMVSTDQDGNLAWLVNKAEKVKTTKIVEQLYMLTLSRLPRTAERDRFAAYIDLGGPSGDKRKAIGDVYWALLNCSEFSLNH